MGRKVCNATWCKRLLQNEQHNCSCKHTKSEVSMPLLNPLKFQQTWPATSACPAVLACQSTARLGTEVVCVQGRDKINHWAAMKLLRWYVDKIYFNEFIATRFYCKTQHFARHLITFSRMVSVVKRSSSGGIYLTSFASPFQSTSLLSDISSNWHHMAVGQNLRYLFGDDYPAKVVYFKGFWDVHRGTGVLTHCHISLIALLIGTSSLWLHCSLTSHLFDIFSSHRRAISLSSLLIDIRSLWLHFSMTSHLFWHLFELTWHLFDFTSLLSGTRKFSSKLPLIIYHNRCDHHSLRIKLSSRCGWVRR